MATKIKLTKTAVEKLPLAEKGKQVDYYDSELDGFGVRVSATGKRYFVRRLIGTKRVRVMLGSATVKSAETARSEARIKLGLMESGTDPNEEKRERIRLEILSRNEVTVNKLVDEYLEKHAKPNKKTWRRDEYCLTKDVLPVWGKLKAKDIRKRDVVLLLEKIIERGAPGQSRTVFEVLRRMFAFAVERDILEYSPCQGVKALTSKVSRDRVLSANEIKTFWTGLETAGMSDEIKRALKLILVTGARPGEVIGMHTDEIDGDWWQIPADRSKNGIVHRVFLTETAKELIGDLTVFDSETGENVPRGFIFPSPRTEIDPVTKKAIVKPIDVNALAYAIRRNLKDLKRQRKARANHDQDTPVMVAVREEAKIDVAHFTPHDLRRTAATGLAEIGFSNEIIDAILGHKARGVVAVYNRHDYAKEKQQALEAWDRKLLAITKGKENKVIPMRRKKA